MSEQELDMLALERLLHLPHKHSSHRRVGPLHSMNQKKTPLLNGGNLFRISNF